MKNQYFGDIHDYRKYGLLRILADAGNMSLLVAWMLTPNDDTPEGELISYLENPEKKERYHDPDLYDWILQARPKSKARRGVHLIEKSDMLPGAEFHRETVPDPREPRRAWFEDLQKTLRGADLVFLDPDNGIEVKSTPFGRKNSCKYVYWREIKDLWKDGKSLLIYQHFPRVKRSVFIPARLEALRSRTRGSRVAGFQTDQVLFLLALKPKHRRYLPKIRKQVQSRWDSDITCWDPEA